MKKTDIVGIIGGMGSHASLAIFQTIIEKCPAHTDQEFIEVILHNNSKIPDRTEAILNNGESPVRELVRSVRMLHAQQANYIIMACVTAYHYYDQLKQSVPEANIINLLDIVTQNLKNEHPATIKIGVIASTGVVRSGLWNDQLAMVGMEPVYLSNGQQERYFTDAIYGPQGIKRGYRKEPREKLLQAGERLMEHGAQVILSSCSELPLVLSDADFDVPFVDAFDVLTDHIIGSCYHQEPVLK